MPGKHTPIMGGKNDPTIDRVRQRFGGLDPTYKRLVMLGLLLACALGVFSLSCLKTDLTPTISCSRAGAWELGRIFVAALIANQAAFSVSPQLERQAQSSNDG
jgi:hypothetical protein